MEQNTQQNIQKIPFSITTKFTAWLMITSGAFGLVASIIIRLPELIIFLALPSLFFFFLPGLFLLARKRGAWWFSVIMQLLLILSLMYTRLFKDFINYILSSLFHLNFNYNFPILISVTSFILLLLDRKNFFKIAS